MFCLSYEWMCWSKLTSVMNLVNVLVRFRENLRAFRMDVIWCFGDVWVDFVVLPLTVVVIYIMGWWYFRCILYFLWVIFNGCFGAWVETLFFSDKIFWQKFIQSRIFWHISAAIKRNLSLWKNSLCKCVNLLELQ